jgi:hypothetical protein
MTFGSFRLLIAFLMVERRYRGRVRVRPAHVRVKLGPAVPNRLDKRFRRILWRVWVICGVLHRKGLAVREIYYGGGITAP